MYIYTYIIYIYYTDVYIILYIKLNLKYTCFYIQMNFIFSSEYFQIVITKEGLTGNVNTNRDIVS